MSDGSARRSSLGMLARRVQPVARHGARVRREALHASHAVRDDMVNGFGVAHGGIAFSLADSALAFAWNTGGTSR